MFSRLSVSPGGSTFTPSKHVSLEDDDLARFTHVTVHWLIKNGYFFSEPLNGVDRKSTMIFTDPFIFLGPFSDKDSAFSPTDLLLNIQGTEAELKKLGCKNQVLSVGKLKDPQGYQYLVYPNVFPETDYYRTVERKVSYGSVLEKVTLRVYVGLDNRKVIKNLNQSLTYYAEASDEEKEVVSVQGETLLRSALALYVVGISNMLTRFFFSNTTTGEFFVIGAHSPQEKQFQIVLPADDNNFYLGTKLNRKATFFWNEVCFSHYNKMADEFCQQPLRLKEVMKSRLVILCSLLERFSETNSVKSRDGWPDSLEEILPKYTSGSLFGTEKKFEHKPVQIITLLPGNLSGQGTISGPIKKREKKKIIEKRKEIVETRDVTYSSDLGGMALIKKNYYTFSSNRTIEEPPYSWYENMDMFLLSNVAVALRVYLRQPSVDEDTNNRKLYKTLQCATEIWRIFQIGSQSYKRVFQVLMECAIADIGPADPDISFSLMSICSDLMLTRNTPDNIPFSQVIELVFAAFRSKKTRMHLAQAYAYTDKTLSLKLENPLDENYAEDMLEIITKYNPKEAQKMESYFVEEDNIERIENLKLFIIYLFLKDPRCFQWLKSFFQIGEVGSVNRLKKQGPRGPIHILEFVFGDIFGEDKLQPFFSYYAIPGSPKHEILCYLAYFHVWGIPIGKHVDLVRDSSQISTELEQTLLDGDYSLVIDRFCITMDCSVQKKEAYIGTLRENTLKSLAFKQRFYEEDIYLSYTNSLVYKKK